MAALNDLNIKVGDVFNAYITAPTTKRVWTVLVPEFGDAAGKSAIIVHTLHGLKSAGAAFHAHLASFMHQMGHTSCKADTDSGIRLRPGLMMSLGIMPTYNIMLMTFYVYTMNL
jgi:hypothetical protein